jgi:hypothetical protein
MALVTHIEVESIGGFDVVVMDAHREKYPDNFKEEINGGNDDNR